MENNFYNVAGMNEPDFFEKLLSSLEGEAAKVISAVRTGGCWPLKQGDREILANFAAVQYLRGPNRRRAIGQMLADIVQLETSISGREGVIKYFEDAGFEPTEEVVNAAWKRIMAPDGPQIEISPAQHIEHMATALPQVLKFFVGRPWVLVRFGRKKLITCDTPVSLMPGPNTLPVQGVGLANALAITLPLARDVGLLMVDPGGLADLSGTDNGVAAARDRAKAGNLDAANLFNDLTIRNARRAIFHHPKDGARIPKILKDPVEREFHVRGLDGIVEQHREPSG